MRRPPSRHSIARTEAAAVARTRRDPRLRVQAHGALSLFAALNTVTGEMLCRTAPRHTSEQFVAFLTDVVSTQDANREIHVICNNVSSHRTARVEELLTVHPNVGIRYTPTYSSWLYQVENWFSRIQRDVVLARGIFTSVKDLGEKLMRYIREHDKDPKPIKWKYADFPSEFNRYDFID